MLRALGSRGITRLMVEGGPILAASLVAADLVDEAAIFRGNATIGSTGIDALEGLPLSAVTASPRFVLRERRDGRRGPSRDVREGPMMAASARRRPGLMPWLYVSVFRSCGS